VQPVAAVLERERGGIAADGDADVVDGRDKVVKVGGL
jgi:hypothetical protein